MNLKSKINPSFINVRKRKFDDSIKSEWEGERLSSPDSNWLLILHHPKRHLKFTQHGTHTHDLLFLHCFYLAKPLAILLEFALNGEFRGAKCDASLPIIQKKNLVEFIDLDLDLIVESNLTNYVRDKITFAENSKTMGYPASVVQQAQRGIDLAKLLVINKQFPFDERHVPTLKTISNL